MNGIVVIVVVMRLIWLRPLVEAVVQELCALCRTLSRIACERRIAKRLPQLLDFELRIVEACSIRSMRQLLILKLTHEVGLVLSQLRSIEGRRRTWRRRRLPRHALT